MNLRLPLATAGLALVACTAPADPDAGPSDPSPVDPVADGEPEAPASLSLASLDPEEWNVAAGDRELFWLAWRPVGGEIPRNESCELEVVLFRDGQPITAERVDARGWMPDHQHGFVRSPLTNSLGGGRYHVEGVLFHMRGSWQLIFDVNEGNETDKVTFDVTIG